MTFDTFTISQKLESHRVSLGTFRLQCLPLLEALVGLSLAGLSETDKRR